MKQKSDLTFAFQLAEREGTEPLSVTRASIMF